MIQPPRSLPPGGGREPLDLETSYFPLLRASITALVWAALAALFATAVVLSWEQVPWWQSLVVAASSTYLTAGFVGILLVFLPQSRQCTVAFDGERVIGVETWWLTITGCDLRRPSEWGSELSSFLPASAYAAADDRHSETWVVHAPGNVTQHHRVLAWFYNVGRQVPRVSSPWVDIKPPKTGNLYLTP